MALAWGDDDLTIANVVQTVAEDHGLKALIDESLGAVVVGHIDQVGESDASRLTRLARLHDAVYKHGGNALIMARRGARPHSLSTGRSLAGRAVSAGVLRWAVRYDARPEVARVVAAYQDLDAGAPGVVEAGSGRPTKRLPTTYASEQAAMAAAEAHLAAASRCRRSARCAGCEALLTAAEYRYCSGCRAVLWAGAPLPEGHPAGARGLDLVDGWCRPPTRDDDDDGRQLELLLL